MEDTMASEIDGLSDVDGEQAGEASHADDTVKMTGDELETLNVETSESATGALDSEDSEEGAESGVVASAEAGGAAEKKVAKKKKGRVPQTLKELDPERAALPWFAVHTYSGFEMRVKLSLEERIKMYKMEPRFGNILVPEETVVELVRGQKKTSQRKFLPGYILVQMHFDEDTWHLVRETPKVTGFVGDSRNPSPLAPSEVQGLITQMQGGAVKPKPKVNFENGDAIKIIDGAFAEFNGVVDEVKTDKGKLRVLISIFGRSTPVELDFVQVEKV
jgi:transcriptional antiterminator NusG